MQVVVDDHNASVGEKRRSLVDRTLIPRLSIDSSEATFARRGFAATPARQTLEAAAAAFIAGHNFAVAGKQHPEFTQYLSTFPPHVRGFAAEGGAMGSATRSIILPWQRSLESLLAELAQSYIHLAHVGVGWTIARVPLARRYLTRRLDPCLAPLAVDGMGFHDGFFGWRQRRMSRAWANVYDQGIGRSLWFACGADAGTIIRAVNHASPSRHDDLWAGIGLACVYAGGSTTDAIDELISSARNSSPWLRQGAAFALAAHARAQFVPSHASAAVNQICGISLEELPIIVEEQRVATSGARQPLAYQSWRRGVAFALERLR